MDALGLSVDQVGEHRLHVDGRTLSARCAWDTLYLPELLGVTAAVTSLCPVTGSRTAVTVIPAGPVDLTPPDTVTSYLAPQGNLDHDVVHSFCDLVNFFATATPHNSGRLSIRERSPSASATPTTSANSPPRQLRRRAGWSRSTCRSPTWDGRRW